jgi:hypothetical protein
MGVRGSALKTVDVVVRTEDAAVSRAPPWVDLLRRFGEALGGSFLTIHL